MSDSDIIKVYRVYDILRSEYWSVYGKSVWFDKAIAEVSWETSNPGSVSVEFNHPKQTRYIIHSFSLLRVLEGVI